MKKILIAFTISFLFSTSLFSFDAHKKPQNNTPTVSKVNSQYILELPQNVNKTPYTYFAELLDEALLLYPKAEVADIKDLLNTSSFDKKTFNQHMFYTRLHFLYNESYIVSYQ